MKIQNEKWDEKKKAKKRNAYRINDVNVMNYGSECADWKAKWHTENILVQKCRQNKQTK